MNVAYVGLHFQVNAITMKQSLYLKHYQYLIPTSSETLRVACRKSDKAFEQHRPLLWVAVNFENNRLKMEGAWQYVVTANEHNKAARFTNHKDRIFIYATLYPALPVDLNCEVTDGWTLPLQGSFDDGKMLSSCSGLLTVNTMQFNHRSQWVISCCISDLQYRRLEIKLNLPI
jgi:hypothetical protein